MPLPSHPSPRAPVRPKRPSIRAGGPLPKRPSTHERAAPGDRTFLSRPRRVAIAEDDEGFRSALTALFRAEGFVVTECHDGRELLHALDATPRRYFDVVIADHRMPLMSGLEVLAQAGGRAPFILVSGVRGEDVDVPAGRFGAAAVLRKPVDLDRLVAVVKSVLPAG